MLFQLCLEPRLQMLMMMMMITLILLMWQISESVAGVQLRCSGTLEFCALKKDASHIWNFNIISVSLSLSLCLSLMPDYM